MESQKEIHTVLLKLHMHGIEVMIQVIRIRESLNTLPWVTCSTPFLQFTYQIPNFHFCIGSKTPGQLNSLLPENILIKTNTLNIHTETRF